MTRSPLDKLDPSNETAMRRIIGGAVVTQAVYVAATLGIADKLALGARGAEELANGVDVRTLRRVLRFLVANGVFVEHEDGRFALNAAAEYLQSGHPRSLRPSAIRAGEGMWSSASRMLELVRNGVDRPAFFEQMNDPDSFARRMAFSAAGLGPAIAAHECFAEARSVVDVGGGHGAHLAAILAAHPQLRGVLFDRQPMIAGTSRILDVVRDRCEVVAGDFFESVPRADVYVLSWILHDWSDENARRILRACHHDGATLLIAEVLLPERAAEIRTQETIADPFTLDMQMLLLTGGRERTLDEYAALLRETGFEVASVRTPPSSRGASILTARAK